MLASAFQCVPLILMKQNFIQALLKTTLEADGIRLEIRSWGDWSLPQGSLHWVFLMVGEPMEFQHSILSFKDVCVLHGVSLSQRADLFID